MSCSSRSGTLRCAERSPACLPRCQQLILLLTEDPPMTPAQIGAGLGIPADSIGLARSRCLDELRRHSAITYHTHCVGAPSICRASAVNSPAHS